MLRISLETLLIFDCAALGSNNHCNCNSSVYKPPDSFLRQFTHSLSITDHFHSLGDVGWYVTSKSPNFAAQKLIEDRYGSAYLLTSSAFQLFFGRLYVLFPVKWIFVLAVALFALGSVVRPCNYSSIINGHHDQNHV